jgi:NAD(P)-dependent dehydrogenase (short-subunit alcohol dehydrogenase family)
MRPGLWDESHVAGPRVPTSPEPAVIDPRRVKKPPRKPKARQVAADRRGAKQAANEHRRVQRAMQSRKKRPATRTRKQRTRAVQAGDRPQPASPLPRQHLTKPGLERDLDPAPNWLAPGYRGSDKLEGRVALITGGDSGIGRAVAVLYAREGADVAIVYLDEHEDAGVTVQAVAREGRRCLALAGDVRDPAFCRRAVDGVLREFGHLDILVNNAAFQLHADSLEALTDEHIDLTIRTNLYGYIYMARAALPHLPAGGAIVNCGSQTGMFGSPELLDYSATKGGIHAFSKALAANVVDRGIRVNVVAPGPVWTPLNVADRPAAEVAEFGADTAMRRPAQPEEIAPAFVFLAAPACSSYITGIELPILGGTAGA